MAVYQVDGQEYIVDSLEDFIRLANSAPGTAQEIYLYNSKTIEKLFKSQLPASSIFQNAEIFHELIRSSTQLVTLILNKLAQEDREQEIVDLYKDKGIQKLINTLAAINSAMSPSEVRYGRSNTLQSMLAINGFYAPLQSEMASFERRMFNEMLENIFNIEGIADQFQRSEDFTTLTKLSPKAAISLAKSPENHILSLYKYPDDFRELMKISVETVINLFHDAENFLKLARYLPGIAAELAEKDGKKIASLFQSYEQFITLAKILPEVTSVVADYGGERVAGFFQGSEDFMTLAKYSPKAAKYVIEDGKENIVFLFQNREDFLTLGDISPSLALSLVGVNSDSQHYIAGFFKTESEREELKNTLPNVGLMLTPIWEQSSRLADVMRCRASPSA